MIRHQDIWDIALRFSNHTEKMIVGCLLGGDSMKSGVRELRGASIPNVSELEEAFDAVGKVLSKSVNG
jgi:hypothetical protein